MDIFSCPYLYFFSFPSFLAAGGIFYMVFVTILWVFIIQFIFFSCPCLDFFFPSLCAAGGVFPLFSLDRRDGKTGKGKNWKNQDRGKEKNMVVEYIPLMKCFYGLKSGC